MADGTTLWIKTTYRLYGISLPKLMELGKIEEEEEVVDRKSLCPIPSDFDLSNFPEEFLQPFIYDSKIFLAAGIPNGALHFSSNIYQLCFQDDDYSTRTKPVLVATAAAPSFIPPIPVTVHSEPTFVQIGAKVYLLAAKHPEKWGERLKEDFFVLDPALRDWKRLRLPSTTTDVGSYPYCHLIFAFQGKLFTRYFFPRESRMHLSCFDDQSEDWNEVAEEAEDKLDDPFLIGSVSVPLLRPDQMVALSWKLLPGGRVQLYATLFDCKDNNYTALCYQDLEGLSIITPRPSSMFDDEIYRTEFTLVDIGNGLVCVLVRVKPYPDLVVLVFTLTLQEHEHEHDTTSAPPQTQTFLNVKTHVKRAFSLPPYYSDADKFLHADKLLHAFLAPSTFLRKYDGTTCPPRKQQKLASGTYPSGCL